MTIRGEDDVHVTEEVYKRPLFLQPAYRYRVTGLPDVSRGFGQHRCLRAGQWSSLALLPSCGLTFTVCRLGQAPHSHLSHRNAGVGGCPGCVACLMGLSPSPGRYYRLPLPEQGAPLEAQFDAFVNVLRVSQGRRGQGVVGAQSRD